MDHGILNVPLSKRGSGSIDAQIDRWKAEQARAAKAERKARAAKNRDDKALAKALFAEFGEQIIEKHAAKFGREELGKLLDGWIKWQPIETAPKGGAWIRLWRGPAEYGTQQPEVIARWFEFEDGEAGWCWPTDIYDPYFNLEEAEESIEAGDYYESDEFTHWMPLPMPPNP